MALVSVGKPAGDRAAALILRLAAELDHTWWIVAADGCAGPEPAVVVMHPGRGIAVVGDVASPDLETGYLRGAIADTECIGIFGDLPPVVALALAPGEAARPALMAAFAAAEPIQMADPDWVEWVAAQIAASPPPDAPALEEDGPDLPLPPLPTFRPLAGAAPPPPSVPVVPTPQARPQRAALEIALGVVAVALVAFLLAPVKPTTRAGPAAAVTAAAAEPAPAAPADPAPSATAAGDEPAPEAPAAPAPPPDDPAPPAPPQIAAARPPPASRPSRPLAAAAIALTPPRPSTRSRPSYPSRMAALGRQGSADLDCTIEADGHPSRCEVTGTAGGAAFGAAALDWAEGARYQPARREGAPVRFGHYRIHVEFRLDDGDRGSGRS